MKYFTSDWHAGEVPEAVPFFPGTHSFLRPSRTDILVQKWIEDCHQKIQPEDTLYFLGDLAINLTDLNVYSQLPQCHKILILGDKEYKNKNFTQEEFIATIKELNIFDEIMMNTTIQIGKEDFFVSHMPTDCLSQEKPSLCGHVHGVWRTQAMPNRNPIINVGIDAWGCIVTEEFIAHQFDAIIKGFYDRNCRVDEW